MALIDKSVSLWKSYVGRGAPSNAAGSKVGYGRTKEEAREYAGHWNNQAPWAREKRIEIYDHDDRRFRFPDEEEAAWTATIGGYEISGLPLTPGAREVKALLNRFLYASAILRYFELADGGDHFVMEAPCHA